MNIESFDPFNFEIPEKSTNSIWTKTIAVFLIGIFVLIPLAEIDKSTFDYNEVFYNHGHQDCSHLKCFLTNYQ